MLRKPKHNSLLSTAMVWLAFTVVFLMKPMLQADEAPHTGMGQLGAPVVLEPGDTKESFYSKLQKTPDAKLYLTANESFFPYLGLVASGEGRTADIQNLNSGKSFAYIEKWGTGDAAEWIWHTAYPGRIDVRVWMSAPRGGSTFSLMSGGQHERFSIPPSPSPKRVHSFSFQIQEAGLQHLRLTCDTATANTRLHWIELSGDSIKDAGVLRKRWRPAAAHTRLSSSRATQPIRMWVMEMDAVPGELGFYAPITTPFGYYGPTWKADGTVNASFNFSLWSYGRNQSQPPIEHLSHLLAVGNRNAVFGGFDHEGTGVKIRKWDPLAGHQGQRQVFALRVVSSKMYDTFYSYFYLEDEDQWRLFGIGNKYNKGKPLKSLWSGSFVEVPGPPHIQRTGIYTREMRYRGWVMQEDGQWYQIDQMSSGDIDRETQLTHTARGETDDGRFFLRTGGLGFYKPSGQSVIRASFRRPEPLPAFLTPRHIQTLQSCPSEVSLLGAIKTSDTLTLRYKIRGIGKEPRLKLFWGNMNALTFADRWQHSLILPEPHEGENSVTLDDDFRSYTPFLRILLINDDGQFWSHQTLQAK